MILLGLDIFLEDYSEKNQKYYTAQLHEFRKFLEGKGIASLTDIKKIDVKEFCSYINKKKLRETTKSKRYQTIILYVKFLTEYEYIDSNITIKKPNFTDHISDPQLKKMKLGLIQNEGIIELIRHAKKVNFEMYIILSLLSHNGMRISELLSLKISNIDPNNRILVSGLEINASKESICYYFIPPKLIPDLREYINSLMQKFRDPIYLFPGDTKSGYLSRQNVSRNIAKYKNYLVSKNIITDCLVNPHVFRKTLNFERLQMGCNDSVMALLLNQTPKGTNARYYLDMFKDITIRRNFWDKFTPDYL